MEWRGDIKISLLKATTQSRNTDGFATWHGSGSNTVSKLQKKTYKQMEVYWLLKI